MLQRSPFHVGPTPDVGLPPCGTHKSTSFIILLVHCNDYKMGVANVRPAVRSPLIKEDNKIKYYNFPYLKNAPIRKKKASIMSVFSIIIRFTTTPSLICSLLHFYFTNITNSTQGLHEAIFWDLISKVMKNSKQIKTCAKGIFHPSKHPYKTSSGLIL